MIHGLAAAVFLFLTLVFLGVATQTGSLVAMAFVVLNGLLFVLNLMLYGKSEEKGGP